MDVPIINLEEKFSRINNFWDPKRIAQVNDYQVKIARIQGEFVWHSHPETDEFFLVVEGSLIIHLPDQKLTLHSGECCVIPAGMKHKPAAEKECRIVMFEPAGTLNTGDAGGERTVSRVKAI